MILMAMPLVYASTNLEVTAFSCNPSEVVNNNQFSCTATVQNTGTSSGTLNTATLYPDSSNWLENSNYPKTVNANINSGASTEVTFTGLKAKKSGDNGFSKIMLDDATDNYVSDNGVTVNVIDVIVTASSSASSAASGVTFDVTGQATAGGNSDIVLSFSGCSIGSQSASLRTNDMSNGQTTSHTWTVTMGSSSCSYSISAQSISNPSGVATKTDSASSTVTCTNCTSGSNNNNNNPGGSITPGGGAGGVVGGSSKKKWDVMDRGIVHKWKLSDSALGIKEISIEVHNKAHNVTITIMKLAGQPASVTHTITGTVFQWINITHDNLTDDNVKSLSMRFNVSRFWLINSSFSPDDVRLQRYDNGWIKLVTTRVSESSNEYEYEALSPGLSVFAVTAEQAAGTGAIACGNNVREGAEQCDGTDLAGQTCVGLGYAGGTLGCTGCIFNTAACTSMSTGPVCGNAACESGENSGNCPSDCVAIEIPQAVKENAWWITVVVLIVVGILGYFYYHGHKHLKKFAYKYKK